MNQVLKKYNGLSDPVKASLWFTVCNILQKGIALLSTPIFTRIMTTDQYGVYTVYQSWYQIITVFATLNLSAGVFNNGLTKFPEDKKKFVSSMQGLSTTVTLLLCIVFCVNIRFWERTLDLSFVLIIALFVQLLFEPAYLFWSAEQRYMYKYKKLVAITIFIALGSPILGIITVISTEFKAEARILSFVAVQAIVGIVFYVYNAKRGKKFFDNKYWKYALSFNIPLIPHYLSMTILNQSDRIMINSMVGKSEAAVYAIAYTIAMMMTIITTAINNSFIPYTYKGLTERKYLDIKKNSSLLLVIVGGGCVLAMAFGPELIKIFASKEYYEAIWVMPPVAASVYFMFLYPLFANVEFFYEKTKFIMVASCIGAGTNILLNFIFIKIFGYIAAGYTTLACYILFAFAHYFFYKRIFKENIKEVDNLYDMRFILGFSLMIIVVMIGMTIIYEMPIVRYSIIILLFAITFWNRKKMIDLLKSLKK